MKTTSRSLKRQLLAAVEDGDLSAETVLRACLNRMSEEDIEYMCENEGLLDLDEDEGFMFDEY